MNGNKPDYTPYRLNPTWPSQPAYQNVTTIAGTFNAGGTNFTTNERGAEPFVSLKLFPNVFARRLVLGGFILKTGGTPQTYVVGFTDTLPQIEPTWIYFTLSECITEAHGRSGLLIDQLTFGVTRNFVNPDTPPTFHSVGGANGAVLFDATPPPNLNGHCCLVGLNGQTSGDGMFIQYVQGLDFLWSCVGKPQKYN